jgi:hypothetical protein
VLYEVVLLQLVHQGQVAHQQLVVLLRDVERVAVGRVDHLSQEMLGHGVVTAADYTGYVSVDLVLQLAVTVEQLLEDVYRLGLLTGQVLYDALYADLLPPQLLSLKGVVQQYGVALLASLRQALLLRLGLEPMTLYHFVHVPRRTVVVDHVVDNGEQLFKRLPVSESNGSDDEVGLILETKVLKHIL